MRETIDDIIRRLGQEFIETCLEKLAGMDALVLRLESGTGLDDAEVFGFQRELHSIKGQGGTFGFPLVTQIAHRLEDYLAAAGDIRACKPNDLRIYVERMSEIVGAGHDPAPDEVQGILRALPVYRAAGFSGQARRDVRVHLTMATGVQQRMVREELLSCGFHVTQSRNAMEALASLVAAPPEIVIASQVLDGFSGIELARVLRGIEATRRVKFVLLTSYDDSDRHLSDLPMDTVVIVKDKNYARRLADRLLDWGIFGSVCKARAG